MPQADTRNASGLTAEEAASRLHPVRREEIVWARERPAEHRTPTPAVGDRVFYRHSEWDPHLHDATVLAVQHPHEPHPFWGDPRDHGNLWRPPAGVTIPDLPPGTKAADLPAGWLEPVADPWVILRLSVPGLPVLDCVEARIRGSAGWLPLDWRARYRPTPNVFGVLT